MNTRCSPHQFLVGSRDFCHVQSKSVAVVAAVGDFTVSSGGVAEVNERGFPHEMRVMSPHERHLFGSDAMRVEFVRV